MKTKDCLYWALAPFVCCCVGVSFLCTCSVISLCTCTSPLNWGHCRTSANNDRNRRIRLADEEARRKDTPIALPPQRPRALTAPVPSTRDPSCEPSRSLGRRFIERRSPKGQWTSPQKLSPFFEKLPLEIRHQIYICVFQDDAPLVHIVHRRGRRRLGHLRCRGTYSGTRWLYASCWSCKANTAADWYPSHRGDRTDGGVLPLLRSCRKLYAEAIDILYRSLTFAMANLTTMILFSLTVLPQRLNAVRRLQLTYTLRNSRHWREILDFSEWRKACGILSRMSALEELGVDINDAFSGRVPLSPIEEILGPLTALTAIKDYVVRTNWPLSDNRTFLGEGMPFRLIGSDDVESVEVAV